MLIFAAFTVDFGSWYTRSAEIKRAADAAALAGVVWMPEFDLAQSAALDCREAERLRSDHEQQHHGDRHPDRQQQPPARVTIRDNEGEAVLLRSSSPIASRSDGRRSPNTCCRFHSGARRTCSARGDLSLAGQPATQNFWAAVNGYCAGHESGDPKLGVLGVVQTRDDQRLQQHVGPERRRLRPRRLSLRHRPTDQPGSMKLDVYDGTYNQPAGPRGQATRR